MINIYYNNDKRVNVFNQGALTEAYTKDKENKLNVVRQQLEYNPDGTISGAVFNNIYYNYDYNIEGLLKRKSASGKTLLEYTYDKNNNIKTIQDITGKYSKYTYDKADRLRTIQDENDKVQAQYEYFGNDTIKSVTLGNGVKTEYGYDGDGNVASLVTVTSNGEVLVDYNYAYDLNGNRLQKVSSKHKNFYSYDSMNRLQDSSYDGRKESFTYDKVGNRLTKTTNDITEKYVYNIKNQLKELHNKTGVIFFTHDKQGNTLKEETSTGTNSFEYNTLNQQVKAITKDGNTLVNRYDVEGLRYEIEENEALSKFIFNKNGDTLVELNKDNEVVSRFTRGYEIVAADVKDDRYYYSVDEQGSTEFITDENQKVRNEYRYDAFGNVLDSREDIHNRITYTGQQFDGPTQQYYLRARFYNPVIGRFTQEDEYRGDGLNLYAYCGNNPVVYYDPSGYANCDSKANQHNKTKEVNKGVSNPELNRLDYLRNKYGKLTSEEINNRINLRGAVNDEIDRLYKSGISKKELGPAVAGVLDTNTGKYYFGINNIKGKVPTELHPIIKERIDNMPLETYNSYEKWTLGAGSHAEVYALNEAMLANPNAKLEDFMVYVVRSGKKLKPRGLPMPRCPHCEYITDGASYFPEVLKYGK